MSDRPGGVGAPPTWDPAQLDRVIHEPVRLAAMDILCSGYQADYSFLKHALGTSDGNLASHLRVLEDVGYVAIEKRFLGRRPNTLYAATAAGKRAYAAYRQAMLRILGQPERQP